MLWQFMDDLVRQFGGCSEEGITKGQWIDPSDAVHYHDECTRVSVVCDRVMLDEARATVISIGQRLRQRAMYFEVRDYDGVQILAVCGGYFSNQYSISAVPSLKPAFGSAVVDERTTPCIPANLPVPPMTVPADIDESFPSPVF